MKLHRDNFLWLSLLCHLLFFLMLYFFNDTSFLPVEKEKSYYYYVPSYAYTVTSPTFTPSSTTQKTQRAENTQKLPMKIDKAYDLSQLKPNPFEHDVLKTTASFTPSDETSAIPHPATEKYMQAIHLVGEKLLDDPLQKLLGHAITAHLYYPNVARELNLRGVVSIGMTLQPNGEISNAHIIQSSHEHVLDVAALQAIRETSPIKDVDIYLKQAKYLVINIIY